MSNDHCVIVGGSHAAAQLALSLRQGGWEGAITLVSAESFPPYHRPPLSKAYLDGSSSKEKLLLRPVQLYEKNSIGLVLGTRVTAIHRDSRELTLDDGRTLTYSKLALTTGATPRRLTIQGGSLKGVHYLRDLDDVTRIKEEVGEGKNAVIVGGGYIGLETAASLRKLGMQVTVLEAMPRVLQRVTTEEISAFYSRVHREEGVQIICDAAVESFDGTDHVEAAVLTDGTRIAADLIVVGIGVVPETGLAEAAGLEIDNGIVVNEFAQTSDPDIVAAGDCTNHYNGIYERRIRLESVQNATDQAKAAANTLCGKAQAYSALPWFWSDQFDLKLQIAGLSQGFDRVVLRGDPETSRSFAAFYLAGDRLLAVDAINRPKEFMVCRKALATPLHIGADQLADEGVELHTLLSKAKMN